MIRKKEELKAACDKLLAAMLGYDAILCSAWWKSENKAFDGKTPQEVFDGDGASEVFNYLMHHAFVGGGS